jgi:hypothetical protein
MERFFNTAGPIKTDIHYYVPMEQRWDFEQVMMLIQQQKYFILHAPRQTGKTSSILSLADYLNEQGDYEAVYANVEPAQAAREDVDAAMLAITGSIASAHRYHTQTEVLEDTWREIFDKSQGHRALEKLLSFWSEAADKPVVLILDEVDALIGDTLISLLRQIRSGYQSRPQRFPSSIILCGVRDVRDYRIHSSRSQEIITGGSAFNIKAESLRMENFSKAQVAYLYQQHTEHTGQVWEEGILDLAWHYTAGQPWLVNALAYEITYNMRPYRDRSKLITVEAFREAKERLIQRRDTHLDQLIDKLREDRVRRVIAPLLGSEEINEAIPEGDLQYVIDLGLVHRGESRSIEISNAIYQEIIPRELTYTTQVTMAQQQPAWYLRPDGSLDMPKLLAAFQDFFRKHSEHWIERFDYKEAGPQLLLQAFLQRIVNGGGRIEREYGFGRGRTDLFVEFFDHQGNTQGIVLELKLLRGSLEATLAEGIPQTQAYLDQCGAAEGHLIIFDRDPQRKWEEKIWQRDVEGIQVWGA